MLSIQRDAYDAMVLHGFRGLPLESCGLLIGSADRIDRFVPCTNASDSSRVYSIDGREWLAIERACDEAGEQIVGVMHSHTHTEPYPSPTDVDQAPDPDWHYVIVSYRDIVPSLRSFQIANGAISETPVRVLR